MIGISVLPKYADKKVPASMCFISDFGRRRVYYYAAIWVVLKED